MTSVSEAWQSWKWRTSLQTHLPQKQQYAPLSTILPAAFLRVAFTVIFPKRGYKYEITNCVWHL
jgi:hypothetical protein